MVVHIPHKKRWRQPTMFLRTTGIDSNGPHAYISNGQDALNLWGADLTHMVGVAKLQTWPFILPRYDRLRHIESEYFGQTFIVERDSVYCNYWFQHLSYRKLKRTIDRTKELPFLRVRKSRNGRYWYFKINYMRMWEFEHNKLWITSAPKTIAQALENERKILRNAKGGL